MLEYFAIAGRDRDMAGKVVIAMGILKGIELKGIRTAIIMVLTVIMILMAATGTAYATPVEVSATGGEMPQEKDPASKNSEPKNSTIEYKEERIEEISYKTLYKYSSDLSYGESKIAIQGETGTKKIVGKVITKDGSIVERKELSTTIIKEPVDEIILIGSLDDLPDMNYTFDDATPISGISYDKSVYVSLPDESKGSKNRQEIVSFALQYIGSPYVWGGSSLTGGCDCSGLVYAVFTACGYDVPRNGFEDMYPISMDEILPGDVIVYPGHYAIYIGGGMEISALNYYDGVCITPVGTVNGYYNAIRILSR